MRINNFILLILLMTAITLYGQSFNSGAIHPEQIKTLRVRYASMLDIRNNSVMPARPFLVLKNGVVDASDDSNQLEISFDELSHDIHQYSYTIHYLNADWTMSNLTPNEFLRGSIFNDIVDYSPSVNTSQEYTHYSFLFPNEDMTITASGNYVIQVYEDGDYDKIVAYICFCVVEPLAKIDAQIRPNTDIEINGRYQQVDIDVSVLDNAQLLPRFSNIAQDFAIVVTQNNRFDNRVVSPRPTYIETNRLHYKTKALIFEGGNEFRRFDTYSTYYAGEHIERISYNNNAYHAIVSPDGIRGVGGMYAGGVISDKTGAPYMHEQDANGQFVINAERAVNDIETEAEYMWVHWAMPCRKAFLNGKVYVSGDLFGNQFTLDNQMQYDSEYQCYYLNALLKQGGYDYQYVLLTDDGSYTLQQTEGSHWQTENEYTIYVYYHPFGSRYDQLVGLRQIH